MTKQEEFIADIQAVLNKHKATLYVTDDHKSWGMHQGVVEIDIKGEPSFLLPKWMEYER
jgi:hypothetical protein